VSGEGGSASENARRLRERALRARQTADRLEQEAGAWDAGATGESRVAAALSGLESGSCLVLHDRLLKPGQSHANLDHIVVSPAGVFLVDAKNWAGNITVYDGSLWQHKSAGVGERSSQPMNAQLDKVRRMAEQMETTASCVVEPVLCLAGDRSEMFGEATFLRGVHVVPVQRLATWLLERPRPTMTGDVGTQGVRLSGLFPSATAIGITPAPFVWTVAGSRRPAGHSANAGRKRPPRTAGSGRRKPAPRPKKRSFARFAVGLVALLLFVTVGLKILVAAGSSGGKAIGRMLVPSTSPSATPASWVSPCAGLTDAVVARAVGRPVYKYGPPANDTCRWSYKPNPIAYLPADVRVATGFLAQSFSSKTAVAEYSQDGLGVGLRVPQFATVPGSVIPARLITQPIFVTVTTTGMPLTRASAEKAATMLAQEIAKHMPTGPGSTLVRYR
jgi:hypothetical protein